ncbi:MAG: hypothetical protein MZU91_01475 [Desulfosudis oleivorans]|nr:hypothetical protein [Desulfosudis oleivorans]
MTGCQSIGPHTVTTDRFDYSSAIADSWKQQTLIEHRQAALPRPCRFLWMCRRLWRAIRCKRASASAGCSRREMRSRETTVSGSGQAIYTDRPTITYTPLTGQKFLRGLLTPIDPEEHFLHAPVRLRGGLRAGFDRRILERRA